MPNYPSDYVDFPDLGRFNSWTDVSDDEYPGTHFCGTLSITGMLLHAELIAVKVVAAQEVEGWSGLPGEQVAADPCLDDKLCSIHHGVDAEGHWETLRLKGREYEYVLLCTPHC